jgi:hypothetical protein
VTHEADLGTSNKKLKFSLPPALKLTRKLSKFEKKMWVAEHQSFEASEQQYMNSSESEDEDEVATKKEKLKIKLQTHRLERQNSQLLINQNSMQSVHNLFSDENSRSVFRNVKTTNRIIRQNSVSSLSFQTPVESSRSSTPTAADSGTASSNGSSRGGLTSFFNVVTSGNSTTGTAVTSDTEPPKQRAQAALKRRISHIVPTSSSRRTFPSAKSLPATAAASLTAANEPVDFSEFNSRIRSKPLLRRHSSFLKTVQGDKKTRNRISSAISGAQTRKKGYVFKHQLAEPADSKESLLQSPSATSSGRSMEEGPSRHHRAKKSGNLSMHPSALVQKGNKKKRKTTSSLMSVLGKDRFKKSRTAAPAK